MRALLPLAVLIEVAGALGGGVYAGLTGNTVAVPGALARVAVMATLGYFAARRQSQWALWAFVTLEYATALTALGLGVMGARKYGAFFEPVSLLIFVTCSVLGLTAMLGGRQRVPLASNGTP